MVDDRVKPGPEPNVLQIVIGLQEVIRRLTKRVELLEKRPSIVAEKIIDPVMAPEKPAPKPEQEHDPELFLILEAVAERHGINPARIRGPGASMRLRAARADFAQTAEQKGITHNEIGSFLGGRHATTIREIVKTARGEPR